MSNNNVIYYALACIGVVLLVGALAGVGFFISRRRHQIQMRRAAFGGSSFILTIILVGVLAALVFGSFWLHTQPKYSNCIIGQFH